MAITIGGAGEPSCRRGTYFVCDWSLGPESHAPFFPG